MSGDLLPSLAPQLAVAASGALVLLSGVLGPPASAGARARVLAALGLVAALVLVFFTRSGTPGGPYAPGAAGSGIAPAVVLADRASAAWQALFYLAGLALLAVRRPAGDRDVALLLGSILGMGLIASAGHLLLLFLGLEMMSLPLYLLTHFLRRDRRSLEASIKYFFAGGLASGLFLLGLSLRYAASGSFALHGPPGVSGLGDSLSLVLMGSAALFKVGAVPLHFWLPDVYQAAEPDFTAFMSTAVKAGGFLLLARLLSTSMGGLSPGLPDSLSAVAVATMTAGNLLALRQRDLRRLLGYSSIAHVGYLLAAVWAWKALSSAPAGAGPGRAPLDTVWYYLLFYLFTNTAAFLFAGYSGVGDLRQLRGLGARSTGLVAMFALAMLSLGGIPPTMGFLAKVYVVWDLMQAGAPGLAVAVVANSLLGLGYYLWLVREAVLPPAEAEAPVAVAPVARPAPEPRPMGLGGALVLSVCSALALGTGWLPGTRDWLFALFGR